MLALLGISFGRVSLFSAHRLMRQIFGLISVLMMVSCGRSSEQQASKTTQLTNEDFPCYSYDAHSLQQTYQDMPRNFINLESFQAGSPRRVLNHLTGIPFSYRQWLYRVNAYNGFRIAEVMQPQGVMGVTYFTDGIPTEIHITQQRGAVDFALQHEVGHAIHAKIRRESPYFDREFNQAYWSEAGHASLRAYARSSLEEYFAESFANHYCSRDSQRFLAKTLPGTFRVLRRYLVPAPWEAAPQ